MKRCLFAFLLVLGFVAPAMSQTASTPNEGTRLSNGSGNSHTLTWWGQTGRTYFVQHSVDLVTWIYFPDIIESGTNALLGYGFTVSGPNQFYVRLKYTDMPTGTPYTTDFDGDGLSNWDELQRGTDPFARDTDGDGMSDGNEYLLGRNPLLADSPVDASDRLLDVHTPLAP